MKNKRTKEEEEGMLERGEKDERWETIVSEQSMSEKIMTRCK